MAITLAELKLQARQRADMENSNFVKDSELVNYINNSIAELHDILCEAYDAEYYVTTFEFDTNTTDQEYDLPDDFYELKGVDLKLSNQEFITIEKYVLNDRNNHQNFNAWTLYGVSNVRYRIIGNRIRFEPRPNTVATIKLWYVPVATKLVNESDELDDLNAYSEYVIVDTAIKMMQKEESDVSVLAAQKMALEKRIRDKAANRDANKAESVTDVYSTGDDFYWRSGF